MKRYKIDYLTGGKPYDYLYYKEFNNFVDTKVAIRLTNYFKDGIKLEDFRLSDSIDEYNDFPNVVRGNPSWNNIINDEYKNGLQTLGKRLELLDDSEKDALLATYIEKDKKLKGFIFSNEEIKRQYYDDIPDLNLDDVDKFKEFVTKIVTPESVIEALNKLCIDKLDTVIRDKIITELDPIKKKRDYLKISSEINKYYAKIREVYSEEEILQFVELFGPNRNYPTVLKSLEGKIYKYIDNTIYESTNNSVGVDGDCLFNSIISALEIPISMSDLRTIIFNKLNIICPDIIKDLDTCSNAEDIENLYYNIIGNWPTVRKIQPELLTITNKNMLNLIDYYKKFIIVENDDLDSLSIIAEQIFKPDQKLDMFDIMGDDVILEYIAELYECTINILKISPDKILIDKVLYPVYTQNNIFGNKDRIINLLYHNFHYSFLNRDVKIPNENYKVVNEQEEISTFIFPKKDFLILNGKIIKIGKLSYKMDYNVNKRIRVGHNYMGFFQKNEPNGVGIKNPNFKNYLKDNILNLNNDIQEGILKKYNLIDNSKFNIDTHKYATIAKEVNTKEGQKILKMSIHSNSPTGSDLTGQLLFTTQEELNADIIKEPQTLFIKKTDTLTASQIPNNELIFREAFTDFRNNMISKYYDFFTLKYKINENLELIEAVDGSTLRERLNMIELTNKDGSTYETSIIYIMCFFILQRLKENEPFKSVSSSIEIKNIRILIGVEYKIDNEYGEIDCVILDTNNQIIAIAEVKSFVDGIQKGYFQIQKILKLLAKYKDGVIIFKAENTHAEKVHTLHPSFRALLPDGGFGDGVPCRPEEIPYCFIVLGESILNHFCKAYGAKCFNDFVKDLIKMKIVTDKNGTIDNAKIDEIYSTQIKRNRKDILDRDSEKTTMLDRYLYHKIIKWEKILTTKDFIEKYFGKNNLIIIKNKFQ